MGFDPKRDKLLGGQFFFFLVKIYDTLNFKKKIGGLV
jgi:hypothetical protein